MVAAKITVEDKCLSKMLVLVGEQIEENEFLVYSELLVIKRMLVPVSAWITGS